MAVIMELKIQDGNVVGKLKQAEQGVANLDKTSKRASSRGGGIEGLSRSIRNLAGAYIGFRAVSNVIKTGVDFETTMLKVKAVSKATEKEFAELNKTARLLGKTTTYTASQVGDLEHELAKLGFTSKQITAAAEGVLFMAQATGSDLARAAEVAGNTLRGFNLDANQTMRVADVMALSFTSSALDMERFAESMKYAAPVAASLGMSIEETTAVLGKLADGGISGTMAGTALRGIMLDLAGPTAKASAQIGGMSLQTNSLAEIFEELKRRGYGAENMLDIFDKRTVTAATTLGTIGGPAVEEFTEKLDNAKGAAKDMADTMTSGWEGKFKRMSSAAESLKISFFESFSATGGIIDMLTDAIGWLDKWYNKLVKAPSQVETLTKQLDNLNKLLDQETSGKDMSYFFGLIKKPIDEEKIAAVRRQIEATIGALEKAKLDEGYKSFLEGMELIGAGVPEGPPAPPAPPDTTFNPTEFNIPSVNEQLDKFKEKNEAIVEYMKKGDIFSMIAESAKRAKDATDPIIKSMEKFDQKMALVEQTVRDFGFALGSAFTGNLDGLKQFLKQELILLVNYLEKLVFASGVMAAFKAAWGDWGAVARVAAAVAGFEAVKGLIMSFSGGGVVSEALNGRINNTGLISGPGTGTSDSILARISAGEAILNARAVRNLGASNINYINQTGGLPGYARGGIPTGGNRVENYTGDVYYSFNNVSTDPFDVFRNHRNFIRSRRGTGSLRSSRA